MQDASPLKSLTQVKDLIIHTERKYEEKNAWREETEASLVSEVCVCVCVCVCGVNFEFLRFF